MIEVERTVSNYSGNRQETTLEAASASARVCQKIRSTGPRILPFPMPAENSPIVPGRQYAKRGALLREHRVGRSIMRFWGPRNLLHNRSDTHFLNLLVVVGCGEDRVVTKAGLEQQRWLLRISCCNCRDKFLRAYTI
ncbi:hypothetical protein CERZMDRAFT_86040 [Cercospora zeae-maydis SCOH1-5]|uniref:Uncharacterized protein n=1 Tax=Cercospora zeae-maydis SCOH1-5 TaxID=717836 RepID=A0A6A6FBC4_9PEZI|nr:hypothetical protein CERZMDRAFT_86040 [Cercospora zeae-maydis SCOH1-5]